MRKFSFYFTFFCLLAIGSLMSSCGGSDEPAPIQPSTGSVSTFVGSLTGVSGNVNATGTAARFNSTLGMAQDSQGNLFVADHYNHIIRKITPEGVVTTFAGSGIARGTNGTGTAASFNEPYGLVIDAQNNLYVSETAGSRVRKITPAGVVTTLAGSGTGTGGSTDGTGTDASFTWVTGIALDNAGNLFVVDYISKKIRKIVISTGVVTTFAGGDDDNYDGQGTAASFSQPRGLCIDAQNNIYVADKYAIRKITPSGLVSTLAGGQANDGFLNGQGTAAKFGILSSICVDATGNLYAGDMNNGAIRKISPTGLVTDFAGITQSAYDNASGDTDLVGDTDGTLTTARFRSIASLLTHTQGIFVSEWSGHRIRKIELD